MVALAIPPAPAANSADSLGALGRLRAGVDAVAAEGLDGLSDAAVGEDLVALRRQIDRLELEFSRRLRAFDAQRGWAASGAASCVGWLRNACRLSPAAAAQQVDVARHLPDLPSSSQSAGDGSIGFHHAAVIARCATEIGADPVRNAEPILVEAARKLDPRALRVVTRRLRYCVDPDGTFTDAEFVPQTTTAPPGSVARTRWWSWPGAGCRRVTCLRSRASVRI